MTYEIMGCYPSWVSNPTFSNGTLERYIQEVPPTSCSPVHPYPDVLPALSRLKADYTLVSVTNGTTEIDKTPLNGIFHHSLNAKQVGHAKPHPAIFERVVEMTGSCPDQILHIGDDPLRDVASARSFGLHVLWLNRHEMPWPDDIERAEIEISSLSEL